MAPNEESLVARCIAGDAAAWDAFVAQYAGLLLGAVRATVRRFRLPHDDADLDDAVADTFLALFNHDRKVLRRYDPAQPIERWLSVIARARCIDYFRRKRPGRFTALPNADPPAPERDPAQGDTAEAVQRALDQLAPRDALVLRLLYYEEMGYEQIGRVVGLTANAVGVAVHRAKTRLAKELTSMGLESPE